MRFPSIFRKRRPVKAAKCQRRLTFETLEQRKVMSVSLQLSGSVLNITGDARNDDVALIEMRSNPASPVADLLQVIWKDDLGKGGSGTYANWALSKIVFKGNGGTDVLRNVFNPSGLPVFYHPIYGPGTPPISYSMLPSIEAHGGAGNDILFGGPKSDWLYGDDGQDTLYGYCGNDVLDGGRNNDVLYGGPGDDEYDFNNQAIGGGSLGFDTVNESGNDGSDTLYFFAGYMNRAVNVNLGTTAQQVVNEFLTLKLSDGASIENVQGTYYNDVIRGNALANYIYGSDGNDTLYGMAGDDTLDGSFHNDVLYGGAGKDTLRGGEGNDILVSIDGSDNDKLYGEGGTDSFWLDWWSNWVIGDKYDADTFEYPNNWHGVKSFANGADKTLDGDAIADPGSGVQPDGTPIGALWYKNFSNRPLFAASGPSPLDVDQNDVGDCWLMAALGSAAKANPNSIRQTVVDLGDGTYAVELGGAFYRVDGDLPTTGQFSNTLRFAGLGQQGSIWVPIVEKAYAFYRSSVQTYGSLNNGWPKEVFQAIGQSGLVGQSFSNGTDALKHIASELASGKAVAVNIANPSAGSPLVGPHSYMVEKVNYAWFGTTQVPVSVVLRNPHAADANPNDGVNNELVTATGQQLVASMFVGNNGIHSAWVA